MLHELEFTGVKLLCSFLKPGGCMQGYACALPGRGLGQSICSPPQCCWGSALGSREGLLHPGQEVMFGSTNSEDNHVSLLLQCMTEPRCVRCERPQHSYGFINPCDELAEVTMLVDAPAIAAFCHGLPPSCPVSP